MAKIAKKRENGEGYVEKKSNGNYACTITSQYVDPNTLRYKRIKRTMPTAKEAIAEATVIFRIQFKWRIWVSVR